MLRGDLYDILEIASLSARNDKLTGNRLRKS